VPRFANVEWELPRGSDGRIQTWDAVKIAVLMDIREELRAIRARLDCQSTLGIPRQLERIARNTAKPRKRKASP
jgi:hypothetical protein